MLSKKIPASCLFYLAFFWVFGCQYSAPLPKEHASKNAPPLTASLQPDPQHPAYWQYEGKTTLLLGGSDEDNLFQMPKAALDTQLALLQENGGNYVRCTMSSRDSGNVWAFAQEENGLFNLREWNEEYWQRLAYFLEATEQRGIIVQLEVWATFDFYRGNWAINPFNPKNNINYTQERVDLPLEITTHPTRTDNPFFWSVPSQHSNLTLLGYQQQFVDKLLSFTLARKNVLYCMDNETSVTSEWGKFWSLYIQKIAEEQGKKVYTTEMWDPWDLAHAAHRETLDHPEIYGFADISQNNHNTGQLHWDNGLKQVAKIAHSSQTRPLNNVKIYGNDGGRHKTTKNAIEAFVRNVFFGAASARFHRPTSGQGLNSLAQRTIKSMCELSDNMDFFNGVPLNHLLADREENEAYARGIEGTEIAIYFTNKGEVSLKNIDIEKPMVKWLNVQKNKWLEEKELTGRKLICPDNGDWIALIKHRDGF